MQGADVVKEVNLWAENSTNGVIKNLVLKFDKDTILVLANALYFKGSWRKPFSKHRTLRGKTFHLLNGDTALVSYLHKKHERCPYVSCNDYKLLKIPYENGLDDRQFSMYIFLPNERRGLHDFIQKHLGSTGLGFTRQEFALPEKWLDTVILPKFKFSYRLEKLLETMETLGLDISSVGLTEVAQCVGLTEVAQCDKMVAVTEMVQKSGIEVDEEGTEAASASYARVSVKAARVERMVRPREEFIADHPFIFMIREDTSKVVFFLGAVINPLLGSSD